MADGAPKKVMDNAKFRRVLAEFKFTDFHTGIAETVKYYESVFQIQTHLLYTVATQMNLAVAAVESRRKKPALAAYSGDQRGGRLGA